MIAPIGLPQIGYWISAAVFLLAAALGAASDLRDARKWSLVAGCITTAAWAAVMALAFAAGRGLALASALEVMRDATWLVFLLSMQGVGKIAWRLARKMWPLVALAAIGCIAGLSVLAVGSFDGLLGRGGVPGSVYPELLLSILALVSIENLYRNSRTDGRWGIKTLCMGLGLVFIVDFGFYADAVFTGGLAASFVEGRGLIDALAAPLVILSLRRSKSWRNEIRISRDMAFHSVVLVAGGVYLMTMAALGMMLRVIGGWPALQLAFPIATVLAMLVLISSKSFRSAIRTYISKHFFRHKYDYRDVWLKFVRDISSQGREGDLQNRVLHAVADIFDCPAGGLWIVRSESNSFVSSAQWNLGADLSPEPAAGSLARYLETRGGIVEIVEYRRNPDRYPGLTLPSWLETSPRAWLLAPLIHHGKLQAFLVLGTPRASVEITWEEVDLLKTIGEQAASYLAEEQASRALADATRLEDFSRWSAFLVHDIKNIVGQMSLMVANAEQHAHDHAFQRDVIATVANAVARMRAMLEQLNGRRKSGAVSKTSIDVAALLHQVGDKWRRSIPSLQIVDANPTVLVETREETLVSVLDHLIQNAFEASGPQGHVWLALRRHEGEGMLEVRDDGPGMDREFVQDELFKPLSSSKPDGFGMGAFQVNQLVRGMGGRIEVDTSPGMGTTMRVHLPIQTTRGAMMEEGREAV
jgi:putative PEP-CTERM system histidine kinase